MNSKVIIVIVMSVTAIALGTILFTNKTKGHCLTSLDPSKGILACYQQEECYLTDKGNICKVVDSYYMDDNLCCYTYERDTDETDTSFVELFF